MVCYLRPVVTPRVFFLEGNNMELRIEVAYEEGYAAGADGKKYHCPYDVFTVLAKEYAEGFKDGKHERKQKLLQAIEGVK